MSDIYRELENTVSGRRVGGIGVLGWLAILFFTFVGLVGVGVWTGLLYVRNRVEEFVSESRESPAVVAARMLSRIDPEFDLSSDQARDGDGPLQNLRDAPLSSFNVQDLVEGSLYACARIKGNVSIDLRGDERGGTLVVETPEVRTTCTRRPRPRACWAPWPGRPSGGRRASSSSTGSDSRTTGSTS